MSSESSESGHGEARPPESPDLEVVARRLREIQCGKRGRIRWGVSRHTAELALDALKLEPRDPYERSAKSRRRKRRKRLL